MAGSKVFFVGCWFGDQVYLAECERVEGDIPVRIIRSFFLPKDERWVARKLTPVFVALPDNDFFIKQVDFIVPPNTPLDLPANFEAEKTIPFDLSSVCWSYAVVQENDEEITVPAILLASKIEKISSFLNRMGTLSFGIKGIIPCVLAYYYLLLFLDKKYSLRDKEKIALFLCFSQRFTSVIIFGAEPKDDWIRTFSRTYGSESLIWDIRELLEAYFAAHSVVLGEYVLTKDIKQIYYLRLEEVEPDRDWEIEFTKEMGMDLAELPLDMIFDDMMERDEWGGYNALCLGVALAVTRFQMGMPAGFVAPVYHAPMRRTVPKWQIALQILFLFGLIGLLVREIFVRYLPLKEAKKQISNVISEYKQLEKSARKFEQERMAQMEKRDNLINILQAQLLWEKTIELLSQMVSKLDGVVISELTGNFVTGTKLGVTFVVRVYAASYEELNELLENLRRTNVFTKVYPITSKYDRDRGKVDMLLRMEKWYEEDS